MNKNEMNKINKEYVKRAMAISATFHLPFEDVLKALIKAESNKSDKENKK